MKVFVFDHYLDLSYNLTLIKKWPCKMCGHENSPDARVDTETIFGDQESFCLNCWYSRITGKSYLSKAKNKIASCFFK